MIARRRAGLIGALLLSCSLASPLVLAEVLPVSQIIQEQDQWCWAGVSACIFDYYGQPRSQCVIAEYARSVITWHDFGSDDCCQNPSGLCNYWNYLNGAAGAITDILDHWGLSSTAGYYTLSLAQIEAIILDHRPFVVRWGWDAGGGHFVLGHGVEGDTVHYMNPWFGEGLKTATYSWLVQGGGHTWTHTLEVTSSHCSCDTSDACCDGCEAINEGGGCDDGDACTQADTCQAGVCQGADAVICQASDQCHVAGSCDPASGLCSDPPAGDGSACDDADACTQTDTCQAGVCQGTDAVVCQAADACHLVGSCDAVSGLCSNPTAPDGTGCDDADACTQTDTCQQGACAGGDPVICQAADQCHLAGSCDAASGLCSNPVAPDGTACDDADGCTQTDTCFQGLCLGADPLSCPAPSAACRVQGSCQSATGLCDEPFAADGTACEDTNPCTEGDACLAGACADAIARPDWSPCGQAQACFAADCQPVPPGDLCSDPLLLEEDEPLTLDFAGFHAYLPVTPPCLGAPAAGRDIFLRFEAEAGQAYLLHAEPSRSMQLAAILHQDCESGDTCLAATSVQPTAATEILASRTDTAGPMTIQVIRLDGDPGTLTLTLTRKGSGSGCGCASADAGSDLPLWILLAMLGLWVRRRG